MLVSIGLGGIRVMLNPTSIIAMGSIAIFEPNVGRGPQKMDWNLWTICRKFDILLYNWKGNTSKITVRIKNKMKKEKKKRKGSGPLPLLG
jgi:hypothetical protein